MKYLLDTHALIWYLEDSPNLPSEIKEIIDNNENRIYLCSVSCWEIAIKISIGKLKLHLNFDEFLNKIKSSDFDILQIKDEHLKRLTALPFLHKDPFDRLLVSTAITENLTLITTDENIRYYDVSWVWEKSTGNTDLR